MCVCRGWGEGFGGVALVLSKAPERAISMATQIVKYLRHIPDHRVLYTPSSTDNEGDYDETTLVVQSDASFTPRGGRSQTGMVIFWCGGIIGFHSSRQSFVTVSTAESELCALTEDNSTSMSTHPLAEELVGPVRRVALADNVLALTLPIPIILHQLSHTLEFPRYEVLSAMQKNF